MLEYSRLNGLVPAIVQDKNTNEVLMLAFMNKEAFELTLKTKKATFFSRSRNKLWTKGETSGNYQEVKEILVDCDMDTVILKVIPRGPACHTGNNSCFYRTIGDDKVINIDEVRK